MNYLAAEMVAGEALANHADGDMEVMARRAEKEAMQRAAIAGKADDSGNQKRKFVPASTTLPVSEEAPAMKMRAAGVNPHEINIDDDEEETGLTQRPVPAAVFGATLTADA